MLNLSLSDYYTSNPDIVIANYGCLCVALMMEAAAPTPNTFTRPLKPNHQTTTQGETMSNGNEREEPRKQSCRSPCPRQAHAHAHAHMDQ